MANQPALEDDIRLIQQSIATLMRLQDMNTELNENEMAEINVIAGILEQLSAGVQPQQLPQLPQPTLSIPPLQLNQIPPLPLHQLPPPPQTPPPRQHADRWHTAVSVECIVRGRMRSVKWFSDFQMAYLYVEGIVNDDENEEHDWIMTDFHETANMMDTYWDDGEDGLPIARCDETRTMYIAYYEPSETNAVRAANQETQPMHQVHQEHQEETQSRNRRRRRNP
jgi:hypothetical protein